MYFSGSNWRGILHIWYYAFVKARVVWEEIPSTTGSQITIPSGKRFIEIKRRTRKTFYKYWRTRLKTKIKKKQLPTHTSQVQFRRVFYFGIIQKKIFHNQNTLLYDKKMLCHDR